jgi:formate dehydrogenase iron-sulfur subunit
MYALLYDANLCIGCESCLEACIEENGLPESAPDGLSAARFTMLEERDDAYLRRMCMHCVHPSCASACPVKALEKTPEGPVVYDPSKCIGCRYCMVACPFSIPRYEWDSVNPRVRKCQMCYQRVAKGQPTACAEACPAEATIFGKRVDLIAEAWRRIAAEPDAYAPKVYGLEEAGGTCVLVIGSQPLLAGAFDARIPHEELPTKTWAVLSEIPTAVAVAGTGLLGLHWIIRRRIALAAETAQNGDAPAPANADDGKGGRS